MGVPITGPDLDRLLTAGFAARAFRLEARASYAVGIERDAIKDFASGRPRPPREYAWWQDWLDLVAGHASHGRVMERVRVLAEPSTTYQEWLTWGDRWHAEAGERIFYLKRDAAIAIGLPLDCDFWLLDEQIAAVMTFDPGGELSGIELLTNPDDVRPFREWRELALRHSDAAGHVVTT